MKPSFSIKTECDVSSTLCRNFVKCRDLKEHFRNWVNLLYLILPQSLSYHKTKYDMYENESFCDRSLTSEPNKMARCEKTWLTTIKLWHRGSLKLTWSMLFLQCSTFYQHGLWSFYSPPIPVWSEPDNKQVVKKKKSHHITTQLCILQCLFTASATL